MPKYVPLLAVFVLFCSVGRSSPADCLPDTVQGYINLGADGCRIGATRFFDFETLPGLGLATPLSPPSVLVQPFGVSTPGLQFTVNANAGAGEVLQLRLGYTVVPLATTPIIAARLAMSGSGATDDGATTATKSLCLGDAFVSETCLTATETLIVFDVAGTGDQLVEAKAIGPVTAVGVINDIVVDGGLAGTASLASVASQFTVVPEPQTITSITLALIAGLWLRARRRK